MTEKQLLDDFEKYLRKNAKDIQISGGNKSKFMDANFVCPITQNYISLEAKTFNDTRSNSNFFLSIFGKILKGRHLNSNNEDCKNMNVKYGFLFASDNKKQLQHYFGLIKNDDWTKFCEMFCVEYVFICDAKSNVEQYRALDFVDIASKFEVGCKEINNFEVDDSEETDLEEE